MKAVRLHQPGNAANYVYEDAPDPATGPGDVLVRVRAVALNHLEAWAAKAPPGVHYEQPRILGADVAGVVAAAGGGVAAITVGDEVMVHPGVSCGTCERCLSGSDNLCPRYHLLGQGRDGGMAELVAVPAANVFPKSPNLSFEEAASIPLVFTTALHMIVTRAGLRYGETVLVNAAGSGVGVAATQVARLHGARVIASAGSDAKLAKARELGAHETINYATHDLAEEARRLTDGRGVDMVVENVGGETMEKSVKALARNGRVVTCGATAGNDATINVTRLFLSQQTIYGSFMGTKGELLHAMPRFADGSLRPVVDAVFPLSEAPRAVARMLDREQFGKIVLVPDP
ncbi:MAG TPA: zinc-binding dehydrogenase [Dehalococcoidia bacterium]|nr:zinc-binding dehydrogenase [Dehalococcoidia bacterium]